jgi:hypothetical protein
VFGLLTTCSSDLVDGFRHSGTTLALLRPSGGCSDQAAA